MADVYKAYVRWVEDNHPECIDSDEHDDHDIFCAVTKDGHTVSISILVHWAWGYERAVEKDYVTSKNSHWKTVKNGLQHSFTIIAAHATARQFRESFDDVMEDWQSYTNTVLDTAGFALYSFRPEPPQFARPETRIVVTQRQADFHVCADGHMDWYETGATAEAAIGKFFQTHGNKIGIRLVTGK